MSTTTVASGFTGYWSTSTAPWPYDPALSEEDQEIVKFAIIDHLVRGKAKPLEFVFHTHTTTYKVFGTGTSPTGTTIVGTGSTFTVPSGFTATWDSSSSSWTLNEE